MHRRHTFFGLAIVILAVASTPAIAARGGGGGKDKASISFASVDGRIDASTVSNGSTVSFAVESALESRELLVVTNRCWRNGQVVYNEYRAVDGGLAGHFTIALSGEGAATCEAYVWAYPDSVAVVKGGWMGYSAV